jgi:hypothetical protein
MYVDLNIVQRSDPANISVSKLCCPVCWELLKLLRGKESTFDVRGYHNHLYMTDLPSWLPDSIVQQMVDRFWGYLRQGLGSVIDYDARIKSTTPVEPGHHRNISTETSASGLSLDTAASNPIDAYPTRNFWPKY